MTKIEIGKELEKEGINTENMRLRHFLFRAEVEGIVCSGVDKNGKPTYALFEERIPAAQPVHTEEALAMLALKYFKSHSPATLQDFVWWSGLSITEAKQATGLLGQALVTDKFASQEMYVHESFSGNVEEDVLHFLPSYDEYLISYKDRTATMDVKHHPKAFNNWGIFYPVILYNGKIVGNWKKVRKGTDLSIETSFFEQKGKVKSQLLKSAETRYKVFLSESTK